MNPTWQNTDWPAKSAQINLEQAGVIKVQTYRDRNIDSVFGGISDPAMVNAVGDIFGTAATNTGNVTITPTQNYNQSPVIQTLIGPGTLLVDKGGFKAGDKVSIYRMSANPNVPTLFAIPTAYNIILPSGQNFVLQESEFKLDSNVVTPSTPVLGVKTSLPPTMPVSSMPTISTTNMLFIGAAIVVVLVILFDEEKEK